MVDYSKWKNIEISDDEDDTHPNIDTASLFRWRHQARVERMEEERKAKEEVETKKKATIKQKEDLIKQLEFKKSDESTNLIELKDQLSEIENQEKEFMKKEEELKKKQKSTPWNVDTISKDGFDKSIVNKTKPREKKQMTEEEFEKHQAEFVRKYKKLLQEFGMLKRHDDSKKFLQEHPELACEETANYLVIWCINLEVEEKHELMQHVAHQTICMQYILELSKQLDTDPRACVSSFFSRIQIADKQYRDAFDDELKSFQKRVKERAQIRIEKAMAEAEEEERQNRIGPGGLDPAEVFESLPEALQQCFESRDIAMLQKEMSELPEEEAKIHLKRCIDSGLWVPDAKNVEQTESKQDK
ncbi:Hsp90 co-chaperone Cdc37 [Nymphon striatum]|nr:Hsp90 co-chaperone Cdc37 [Nymphon striatum]KAG1683982.1 Hsp90 co-chaperone Cdc37 [Nymphon striatum]KAG1683983.1 Hsp90 co-chaperone Cdc37 [Nymphon striatum]